MANPCLCGLFSTLLCSFFGPSSLFALPSFLFCLLWASGEWGGRNSPTVKRKKNQVDVKSKTVNFTQERWIILVWNCCTVRWGGGGETRTHSVGSQSSPFRSAQSFILLSPPPPSSSCFSSISREVPPPSPPLFLVHHPLFARFGVGSFDSKEKGEEGCIFRKFLRKMGTSKEANDCFQGRNF